MRRKDALKALIATINAREPQMIESLYQWCNINSGTDNIDGLNKVRTLISEAFVPLADSIQNIPLAPVEQINLQAESHLQPIADALFIQKRPELKRRILLCGHMDTVFSKQHPFQSVREHDSNTLIGPGVSDMKGGLIVMLHALEAFEHTDETHTLGWDVLINSDEEIGSPASAKLLQKLAPNYSAGLVYEPAMSAEGIFAKNRAGSGKFSVIAHGKSAHAGRAFHEGRNAICYLAECIGQLHALNECHEGITLNIGKIAGGSALNVVADCAIAQIDVRITQPMQEALVLKAFDTLIAKMTRPGYLLEIQGQFGRPVKQVCAKTQRLFRRIQAMGLALGLTLDWQDSGGCCDGNNLAAQGLPVIDTLGVRGGKIHSPEEYILTKSLSERATLSSLILTDLAQGGLEAL